MFTVEEIESAHSKVKTGADFPRYIQDIKTLGVTSFETWVRDSHTDYFGAGGYQTSSKAMYADIDIALHADKERFIRYLKDHQAGGTDYPTFCGHCAETGIQRWIVDLEVMACTYFDMAGNEILVEKIPVPNS